MDRRVHITEELCIEARRLLACGHAIEAVAGCTGLTSAVVEILSFLLHSVSSDSNGDSVAAPRGVPMPDAKRQAIAEAIQAGRKVREIVVELRCSPNAIAGVRKNLGPGPVVASGKGIGRSV